MIFPVVDGLRTAFVTEDKDLDALLKASNIEALWLTPGSNTFNSTPDLKLSSLQALYVCGMVQSLHDVLDVLTLKQLRSVVIVNSSRCLDELCSLGQLPELKVLKCRGFTLTEVATSWVSKQVGLQALALTETTIGDQMLANLQCRESLNRLDVFRSCVTLESQALSDVVFPRVFSFDVSETRINSQSVATLLRCFPNVQRLILNNTGLAKSDLQRIALLESLQVLVSDFEEFQFSRLQGDFWPIEGLPIASTRGQKRRQEPLF